MLYIEYTDEGFAVAYDVWQCLFTQIVLPFDNLSYNI